LNEQTQIQRSLPCVQTSNNEVTPCPPQNGQVSGLQASDIKDLAKLKATEKSAPKKNANLSLPPIKGMSSVVRKLNRAGCTVEANNLKAALNTLITKTDDGKTKFPAAEQVKNQVAIATLACDLRGRLKNLEKQISNLEKLLATPETFTAFGVNTDSLQHKVNDMKAALEAAEAKLDSGTSADVSSIKTYFDSFKSGEPQDVVRVITALKQLSVLTSIIKSEDVLDQINANLAPIVADVNKGDYKDARIGLDKIFTSLVSLTKAQLNIQRRHIGKEQPIIEKLKALRQKLLTNTPDEQTSP
jgi:hypothetical protein